MSIWLVILVSIIGAIVGGGLALMWVAWRFSKDFKW
jgi:hypothetical protein